MRETKLLLIFNALYLSGGLAAALMLGITEFLFYLAAAPFLVAGVSWMHVKTVFPMGLLRALSLLGLVHVLGGLITVPDGWPVEGKPYLYNFWILEDRLKYDQVVHAYGNGLATWLCWHIARHSIASAAGRKVFEIEASRPFMLICLFAGVGIGACNELGEFIATRLVEENNVGGYTNTGFDLVYNTLGSVIAVLLLRFKRGGVLNPRAAR